MDGEGIVWLIFVIVWLVSSAYQAIKRVAANRPGQTPPSDRPPPPPGSPASRRAAPAEPPPEALRDLMRQMGFEVEEPVERPVASEHRPTASEHRPVASERRPTASEHQRTASEHRRTELETLATPSERQATASEHRRTASEHRRGDAVLPPIPRLAPAGRRRRTGPTVAYSVRRDLTRGRRTLAEILALREVLGPPVGMRPFDSNNF